MNIDTKILNKYQQTESSNIVKVLYTMAMMDLVQERRVYCKKN